MRSWLRVSFGGAAAAGRLGSLSLTLGAGSTVQILGALAGFVTLPIVIQALGSPTFGVLVVVVSLAPWLTLVDGALYPTARLLIGESRGDDRLTAHPALMRSMFRLALKIAAANVATLFVGLLVLPLVMLFGSQGVADREEIVLAVVAFALPILVSGPGGIYLGALEGVGRTVVAAIFVGIGPLVALPLTVLVSLTHGGLALFCAVQGLAVALPRLCAWVYWRARPSLGDHEEEHAGGALRLGLVMQMVWLSAAVLMQTGLDPVIVSSRLGAESASEFGLANRLVTGALIPLVVLSPLFAANLAAARGSGWSDSRDSELRRLTFQACLAGSFVGACVAVLGPLLARVLGAGQVDAPFGLYLAGGAFVFATISGTPLYLAFAGPRGLARSARLNMVLVALNVGLSLALVTVVGPAGPLWASAVAGAAAFGYWLLMWRRHPDWLSDVHAPVARTSTDPSEGDD